jgi:hypothetical protein
MSRLRLFIASTQEAKNLATALQSCFDAKRVEARVWSDGPYGDATILGTLLKECEQQDFFAVVLTGDDTAQKSGRVLAVPRDNCIFELGLFMGALDLDPQRCFLLTTLDRNSLPSDLGGVIYKRIENFSEKDDLGDLLKCKDAMIPIHASMLIDMAGKGSLGSARGSLRPFPVAWLMEREKTSGGDLEVAGEVFIDADVPLERNNGMVAAQVLENMRADVSYTYFFGPKANVGHIAEMLQTLATAGLGGDGAADKKLTPSARTALTSQYHDKVTENLLLLSRRLSILRRRYDAPLPLCIHNAQMPELAKCYLRLPMATASFVKWGERDPAFKVAEDLQRLRPRTKPDYIFHPIAGDSEFYAQTRADLEPCIFKLFDKNLYPTLTQICFGAK